MTYAVAGNVGYIEPQQPFSAWKLSNRRIVQWTNRQVGNLVVFSPPLPVPRQADPLRWVRQLQIARLRQQLSVRFGPDWTETTTVYITNWSYLQQPLIEQLRPKMLVFDIVDDVLAFPYAFQEDKVIQAWRWLAQYASVVTAVSPTLQTLTRQQLGVESLCLPNGVNAAHFLQPAHSVSEAVLGETDACALRVGFAGTLNHWIDFAAMQQIVQSHPHVHMYLIGREGNFGSAGQSQQFHDLSAHPRVHTVGNIPYEELPGYLHAMDILLLPRIPSHASTSSSPLKLYEYLAVGKPIVVGGFPIPQDIRSLVYDAGGAGNYTPMITLAAAECTGHRAQLQTERQNYALQHTWQQRVQRIQSALDATRQ